MFHVIVEPRTRWIGALRTEIDRAGFRVDGFARRMGVHRTTIWRIDRGEIVPSAEWTARAEALLGIDDEMAA